MVDAPRTLWHMQKHLRPVPIISTVKVAANDGSELAAKSLPTAVHSTSEVVAELRQSG